MRPLGQDRSGQVGHGVQLGVDGHPGEWAEGMHAAEILYPDPCDARAACLGAFPVEDPSEPGAVVLFDVGSPC